MNTIPQGFDVSQHADGLLIRRSWRNWMILPLAIFAAAWDSFLVFWYSVALTQGAPWIMVVFPIAHVAVGVGLTYFVIASLVNRTDVWITQAGLRVWSGPFPWFGNREVLRADVTAAMVRERRGNKGSVSYQVMLADRNRREFPFLRSLNYREQAEFVVREIRNRYGLQAE